MRNIAGIRRIGILIAGTKNMGMRIAAQRRGFESGLFGIGIGGQNSRGSHDRPSQLGSMDVTVQAGGETYRIHTQLCMQHVFKLAIVEDKPIMLDYWTSSLDKSVIIGVRENNEKLLVKCADEYTSPIAKIFKVETEYIIVTENSIYIVASDIQNKRIS
jgi:hypothetical protein